MAMDVLSPDGAIARRLVGYEPRAEQMEMAERVRDAFANRRHLLVEAGTGVGKSFAYLLPAIEYVTKHDKRVVISTNTIALQEQLIEKDIPFLHATLGEDFAAVLVKGRTNYLGLRRLAQASRRQQKLFESPEQLDQLWQIEDWAYKTEDGSLSDLAIAPHPSVWEKARSEHGNCLGRRCEYYKKCFYQQARRRARNAKLLVVNHAMFFSDLAVRRDGPGVLPDYDLVVLDEAHTVEQVAGDHFGATVSETQLRYLLSSLYNTRTRRGLLAAFSDDEALHAVIQANNAADVFFGAVADWQQRYGRGNGRLVQPLPIDNVLAGPLGELHRRLTALRSHIEAEEDRYEVAAYADRVKAFAAELVDILAQRREGWVYWLEVEYRRNRRVSLKSRPVDVGPVLREHLFDKTPVVLTSATLTTGGQNANGGKDFDYIQSRLGVEDADTALLGSPFDYASQVKIYLEADMPDPSDRAAYEQRCIEAIEKYVRLTNGKAFVLFTGYELMNRCAEELRAFFELAGITLMVQGEGLPRSTMLARFRDDTDSVIFGTDSFWTGVDVPGEALSNIIITRLPFASPDRPDVQARIEHLRTRGENPFMKFQLPEAILKFKQGFGRLIRNRTDRGIVVILDPRVRTKAYGKQFLAALPQCEVEWVRGDPEP